MYKKFEIAAIAYIALLTLANAQRPSYAGSRPSGGLNQKDKYHFTQNQTGIGNRFGQPDNITTIPFGTPQNPPMNGTPVVGPQPVYVPLPPRQQDNDIVSRFGAPDESTGNASAGANATADGVNTTQQRLPLPLDAHGDRQLVDQLSRIPVENRPFWFLNYQAIEAQRNGSGGNFAGAIESRGSFFG